MSPIQEQLHDGPLRVGEACHQDRLRWCTCHVTRVDARTTLRSFSTFPMKGTLRLYPSPIRLVGISRGGYPIYPQCLQAHIGRRPLRYMYGGSGGCTVGHSNSAHSFCRSTLKFHTSCSSAQESSLFLVPSSFVIRAGTSDTSCPSKQTTRYHSSGRKRL